MYAARAIFKTESTSEDTMSDNEHNTRSHINTGGGAYVGGGVNTGGGNFVGRDKNVHGDVVQGDKIGTQRNIDTGGGDYSEGSIDKRSGAFVSGGTVYGPVVGSNSGSISASYSGFHGGSSQPTPLQQAFQSVQQAQQAARQRGNTDLADDLDAVIGSLVSALKAQDTGNTQRRATKIRDAQTTLQNLATGDAKLATLVQQLDRLT